MLAAIALVSCGNARSAEEQAVLDAFPGHEQPDAGWKVRVEGKYATIDAGPGRTAVLVRRADGWRVVEMDR